MSLHPPHSVPDGKLRTDSQSLFFSLHSQPQHYTPMNTNLPGLILLTSTTCEFASLHDTDTRQQPWRCSSLSNSKTPCQTLYWTIKISPFRESSTRLGSVAKHPEWPVDPAQVHTKDYRAPHQYLTETFDTGMCPILSTLWLAGLILI